MPLLFDEHRAVGTIGFADAGVAQARPSELERIALRLEAGKLDDGPKLDRFTEFASSTFWKIAATVDPYADPVYLEKGWEQRGG